MAFVAAAIGGAGLLSAGASIYTANKNAQIQSSAAQQAAALQQQQMAQNQGNMQPFISNGQGASNVLGSAMGVNGNPALGQSSLQAFMNSPDYLFALKGGSDALDNSAASKGGLLGGNQIKAQTEYGQGLATQNLQNYFAKLSGMAGQGIQAGGAISGANTVGANNVGNSLMASGTAQAAGNNGMMAGLNNGIGQLSLYNQLNKSSYNGSSPLNLSAGSGSGSGFNLGGTGGLY